jgi:8-oxo-dGTP diphosphatase
MKTRNVALIIFYDKDKRILLQDRRGISKLGAEWGFFGGEIENDETPEQAVVRETKEELCFERI